MRKRSVVIYVQVNALEELPDSECLVVHIPCGRQTQWVVASLDVIVFADADDIEELEDSIDQEYAIQDDSCDAANG